MHAAALDTYTDSNTRERQPYEADGIIAASGRLLVQRDVLFPRHSHSYVINHPTWPIEWKQASAFLGWQDYMSTGQPDLALSFMNEMYDRTFSSALDSTGLLNTTIMGGRHDHIIDWMAQVEESDQTVLRGEYTDSDHMSVTNGWAAQGLRLLATMVGAGGQTANASRFQAESDALFAAMKAQMWNGTAFCDGICSEVGNNSRLMTAIFSLAHGWGIPEENLSAVWSTVADWGIEQIGDYGAFYWNLAIAGGYYASPNFFVAPDDGSAIVNGLTKCDEYSWCSGLRDDNLTMTRESWHAGTYSHGWGSSAIIGVAMGVLGVHQTSPAFADFSVVPKLGSLTRASGVVPSIRGFINVTATPGAVDVTVPCGARATLCSPRATTDTVRLTTAAFALTIDDAEVDAIERSGHLCATAPVGCGAAGAPRRVRVHARAA